MVSCTVVLALAVICLCLTATPARAAGFHSCATQKLENKGIFRLKANQAKCKLARQVAFGLRGGADTPKGFSCVSAPGGNLTPFTCTRRSQVVKFSLEG